MSGYAPGIVRPANVNSNLHTKKMLDLWLAYRLDPLQARIHRYDQAGELWLDYRMYEFPYMEYRL